MLKAIIFDKDGTLIDLGQTWDEPTIKITEKLLAQSTLSGSKQETFKESLGIHNNQILPNTTLASSSLAETAEIFAEILPMSVEAIEDLMEEAFIQYITAAKQPTARIDYAKEILETLSEKYIIGVVTNDNYRIAKETLQDADLLKYLDFLGCADQFGAKPNPAALFEIAKQFDLRLDEMVYVGDSSIDMTYGNLTKASIGLALEENHREFLREADYIINDLKELLPIIEAINESGSSQKEKTDEK